MKLDALYVAYWSLRDPLCQSQSLPVIKALAQGGWKVGLMTFEQRPWAMSRGDREWMHRDLAAQGIHWEAVRYHKRPAVVATLFDIAIGVWRCVGLARRTGLRLFRGRGTVPAPIAFLSARLTARRFLNDADGPLSQEYVDAGVWRRGSLPQRMTASAERQFLRSADAVAVLTERRRREVQALTGRDAVVLPLRR